MTGSYSELAQASTHEIGIGGALISLVELHPGTEHAYNRWYEDDHFYAGAMSMPWMFSGRRFVATRDLQALRHPDPSPRACWERRFAGNGARAAAGGRAEIVFAAPFVPVLHGTDRFVDELR